VKKRGEDQDVAILDPLPQSGDRKAVEGAAAAVVKSGVPPEILELIRAELLKGPASGVPSH
jgi:hypothetical protein